MLKHLDVIQFFYLLNSVDDNLNKNLTGKIQKVFNFYNKMVNKALV